MEKQSMLTLMYGQETRKVFWGQFVPFVGIFVMLMSVMVVVLAAVPVVHAATLVVDTTNDTVDANAGDGVCADSNGDCSLRAAIEEANALTGADSISFNIGGSGVHTITLSSNLPTIDSSISIDGSTQPGYSGSPLIYLDGSSVTKPIQLSSNATNVTIKALDISRSSHTNADGITVSNSQNLTFTHLVMSNWGRAIYIKNSTDIHILNNHIVGSGRADGPAGIDLANITSNVLS